jgi:hypothetical protein
VKTRNASDDITCPIYERYDIIYYIYFCSKNKNETSDDNALNLLELKGMTFQSWLMDSIVLLTVKFYYIIITM